MTYLCRVPIWDDDHLAVHLITLVITVHAQVTALTLADTGPVITGVLGAVAGGQQQVHLRGAQSGSKAPYFHQPPIKVQPGADLRNCVLLPATMIYFYQLNIVEDTNT